MRTTLFMLFIAVVLIGGGLLMNASNNGEVGGAPPGVSVQTSNPRASVSSVTADKGAAFFIFANIALGSVIGFGATLALIFHFLNRQVVRATKSDNNGFSFSLNASNPNSVGGLIANRPAITISIIVVLIIGAAIFAALALNIFG